MAGLFALTAVTSSEQIVKKSRFRAIAAPIGSEDEAKAFLAENSDPTANHNCWAWRIGQAYRFNDDGEPSGTAGKPILQAIDGQALDRLAVVVTRWFGGILLGSGGLIRAYGGTAAICLRSAERIEVVETVSGEFGCSFSEAPLLHARLTASHEVKAVKQDFQADGVRFGFSVEKTAADATAVLIADLTSGRSIVRWND